MPLLNSSVFLMGLWYIHLITSNTNWCITNLVKTICEVYHLALFLTKGPSTDFLPIKVGFVVLMAILHGVYVSLSFYIDY